MKELISIQNILYTRIICHYMKIYRKNYKSFQSLINSTKIERNFITYEIAESTTIHSVISSEIDDNLFDKLDHFYNACTMIQDKTISDLFDADYGKDEILLFRNTYFACGIFTNTFSYYKSKTDQELP